MGRVRLAALRRDFSPEPARRPALHQGQEGPGQRPHDGHRESKEFTGKSLLEGSLRVGYSWGNGKYEAALFGRNITNKIVAVGGIVVRDIVARWALWREGVPAP